MKYSIRGSVKVTDGTDIVSLLNQYQLWKLDTEQMKDRLLGDVFNFEVWLNTLEDKDSLFISLKPFVDQYGELINWHECTHDEPVPQPCTIAEEYRGNI